MRLESFVSDEASAGFGAGFRVKKDLEETIGLRGVMIIMEEAMTKVNLPRLYRSGGFVTFRN